MASRLPGRATVAGTRHAAARFGEGVRTLGRAGLTVSPVGFGGYRVRDDDALHARALGMALDGGVNLLDTSSNYGDGASERLYGRVLAQAIAAGDVQRDGVVVVSKLGYLQGHALARARASSWPEIVEVDAHCWHCIHPEALADGLRGTLERLGLEQLDVLLLHNPEYFLVHDTTTAPGAPRRAEYRRRLREACAWLEQQARAGVIGGWGMSSNGFSVADGAPTQTSLGLFAELAHEVGGADHHGVVAQLPMNPFELDAATEPHADDGGRTALAVAGAADLGVLVNRPLNAFPPGLGRLLRLADPRGDDSTVAAALAQVRKLEAAWAGELGARIRIAGADGDAVDLFRWGRELSRTHAQLRDPEAWQRLRREVIAPHVGQASAALLAHLQGPARVEFAQWWQRYGTALHQAFDAIEARLRAPALHLSLARLLDPWLPEPWRALPLSRKALLVSLSAPVASVLVGMRTPNWVVDVLALREAPARLLAAAAGPVDLAGLRQAAAAWAAQLAHTP